MFLSLDHPASGHDLEVMGPDRLGEVARPELLIGPAEPGIFADAEALGEAAVVEQEASSCVLDIAEKGAGVHEGAEQLFTGLEAGGGLLFLLDDLFEHPALDVQFQPGTDLAAKDLQGVRLLHGQYAGNHVDDAQRAQSMAIGHM